MASVTPDLSRGPVLLSFSVGTASFAFSTTIVRFCVRTRISNSLGADDYAIAVATVVAVTGTIFSVLESSMPDSARALEFDVLGQPLFMMGSTLSKISICLFFIRLLGSARHWRIFLGVMIFLMAVVNLAFSLTTNLQCRPLEKLWNPATTGVCWDPSVQLNFGYFQGAFSVFTWFFLSLFPVTVIRDIYMQGNLRWPFYILSGLSLVVGVLDTVRTYETSQIGGLSVYTYDTFVASLMAILEQNAGIVAANVLPMGPLFSRRARRAATIRAKTPSFGGSTRLSMGNTSIASSRTPSNHSRAPSIQSRMSGHSRSTSSRSLSFADPMRNSTLPIEGPRRVSFDTSGSQEWQAEAYELENQGGRGVRDSYDPEAWPKGIIKTVSVEVVEEDNPDIPEGAKIVTVSDVNVEQDWEAMLRAGPDHE
ncbi:hypothetical protein QBC33DRAFT_5718 [Phialemonium atrogriseum]|uniref:Rhodopsin domain-containing protein n=1 Tax=Phialemonium atrogriseum TaxID=1093897 RepID=A0AAJ0FRE5_9PEZI|nr:uncharacterized protein QBC33DRAFT_5718 [Phialemonium atrogriseum]KAK1772334.1 hypothetical protein QBC33DRAFT_5718 [Phialemonium atrogriseum]